MKIIRGLSNFLPIHQGSAMTIGKFDGVHQGHQQLFAKITQYAKKCGVASMVMIFEPSPNDFFNPQASQHRLSTLREKIFYIAQAKIDYLLIIPFNQFLVKQSANDFIEQFLIKSLAISKLWIGDDFKFGFQRQGDWKLLKQYADKGFFDLSRIDSCFVEQLRVSSSHIRQLIIDRQFYQAEKLLGHPFSVSGYVVKGRQLGQKIGYPTANLKIVKKHQPVLSLLSFGVYLVSIRIYDNEGNCRQYDAVANFGIKPTVDEIEKVSFESHCFDMSESLYGQFIRIDIHQYIRAEKKFTSVEQLKAQIAQDILDAKRQIKKRAVR